MRKTLIALFLACSLPTLAMAMPDEQGQHGPRDGGPRFMQELDLSKQQRQQIGKLMREDRQNHQAITKRYLDKLPEADRKAMEKELEASREQNAQAIRKLLEPEQQKAFDEKRKEMETRRAEREEFEAWKAQRDKAE